MGDLVRGRHRDADLAEELESHLQLHVDAGIRAGMTPGEARRDAILKLGGIEANLLDEHPLKAMYWKAP